MAKNYVGDIGTVITVDCEEDISAATNTILKVEKPDGTEVEWTASIYDTNYLQYTVVAGDFDQEGVYTVQANLSISGWSGSGDSASFIIHNEYK